MKSISDKSLLVRKITTPHLQLSINCMRFWKTGSSKQVAKLLWLEVIWGVWGCGENVSKPWSETSIKPRGTKPRSLFIQCCLALKLSWCMIGCFENHYLFVVFVQQKGLKLKVNCTCIKMTFSSLQHNVLGHFWLVVVLWNLLTSYVFFFPTMS